MSSRVLAPSPTTSQKTEPAPSATATSTARNGWSRSAAGAVWLHLECERFWVRALKDGSAEAMGPNVHNKHTRQPHRARSISTADRNGEIRSRLNVMGTDQLSFANLRKRHCHTGSASVRGKQLFASRSASLPRRYSLQLDPERWATVIAHRLADARRSRSRSIRYATDRARSPVCARAAAGGITSICEPFCGLGNLVIAMRHAATLCMPAIFRIAAARIRPCSTSLR